MCVIYQKCHTLANNTYTVSQHTAHIRQIWKALKWLSIVEDDAYHMSTYLQVLLDEVDHILTLKKATVTD